MGWQSQTLGCHKELVLMEFSIPLLGHSAAGSFEGTPALYLLGFLQKSTGGAGRAQVSPPIPNIPDEKVQVKKLSQDLGIVTSAKERSSETSLPFQPLINFCWCINYCASSKSKAQKCWILLQWNPWHLYHWPSIWWINSLWFSSYFETGVPKGQCLSGAWHQQLHMVMKMETTSRKANVICWAFFTQISQEIQFKANSSVWADSFFIRTCLT